MVGRSDQPVPFKDVLTSSTFKFVIGPDKQEFVLHKQLVASLSPVLDLLINGHMKEAREGCVEWPDLDEDTFTRFAQFAYSGSYDSAKPEAPEQTTSPTGSAGAKRRLDAQPPPQPPRKRARTEEYCLPPPPRGGGIDTESDSESDSCSGSDETETSSEVDTSDSDEDDDSERSTDSESDDNDDEDDDEGDNEETSSEATADDDDDDSKLTNLPYSLESFADWWRDRYGRHTSSPSRCSLKRKREMALHGHTVPIYKHHDLKYGLIQHFLRALDAREPVVAPDVWRNWHAYEDFSPVFLGHARLYVLADKYDIKSLREVTSYNIHLNLKQFVLYYERIPDIAALIRYVYENTTDTSGLRSLLAAYAACVIEDVRSHPDFAECIDNYGDFSRDLVYQMSYRLL